MLKRLFVATTIASGLAIALLSGCGPIAAGGIRELGPERRFVFEAPEGYQLVYRRVMEQARRCYQAGRREAEVTVQGEIHEDTRLGTVTVSLHNALVDEIFQVIDVVAVGEMQTRVIGHYPSGPAERYGQGLKEWVLENSRECGPKF